MIYGQPKFGEPPANPYDEVYDWDDADDVLIITMTRRQWWHLDDWRAEHPDRYPKRAAQRQAALKAIDTPKLALPQSGAAKLPPRREEP